MWYPEGCQKVRKMVIVLNPYPNLGAHEKMHFSKVRRKH